MLTVKQAASKACVSEGLVRGWIGTGQLPHLRVGSRGRRGKILIHEDDLDRLLTSFKVGKREPSSAPPPAAVTAYRHLKLS